MAVVAFGLSASFLASTNAFIHALRLIRFKAISMGAVHWNQCRTSVQSTTPVPPPPGSAPYIIYTPDSNPIVAGPVKNMLNIWLIVYGSLFLAMTALQLFILCALDYESKSIRIASLFFNLLWTIAWIIVGGIFLFTSTGRTCRHSVHRGGYRVWQTSLGMWVLQLLCIPAVLLMMCMVSDQ